MSKTVDFGPDLLEPIENVILMVRFLIRGILWPWEKCSDWSVTVMEL